MENKPEQNLEDVDALETLDEGETQTGGATSPGQAPGSPDANAATSEESISPSEKSEKGLVDKLRQKITQLNIYLLLFILIFIIACGVFFVSLQQSRQEEVVTELTPQELTDEALNEISGNEVKVGDPKQTLNVESNAVFSGQVLVQGSLDVAGAIKAGSALNIPGISVSGEGEFNQLQANEFSVSGNGSIQGRLNVQNNLTVAGGATFGGPISAPTINTSNLQVSGNLVINRHLEGGGGTPGKSDGSALGGGGTASVSGTDTAGTVNINTGNSPGAGCFATINFVTRFNQTPHVVVSPVGSAGGSVDYYVNRNTGGFSICASTPPPGNSNFAFDYIAID